MFKIEKNVPRETKCKANYDKCPYLQIDSKIVTS